VDFWNRLLPARPGSRPPAALEPLSAARIEMGYRLHWLTLAVGWEPDRRERLAAAVAVVIAAPDFVSGGLERRYTVDGLDDRAHSGPSLLALAEVLRALAALDADETNL
jgi:hypothetical protein